MHRGGGRSRVQWRNLEEYGRHGSPGVTGGRSWRLRGARGHVSCRTQILSCSHRLGALPPPLLPPFTTAGPPAGASSQRKYIFIEPPNSHASRPHRRVDPRKTPLPNHGRSSDPGPPCAGEAPPRWLTFLASTPLTSSRGLDVCRSRCMSGASGRHLCPPPIPLRDAQPVDPDVDSRIYSRIGPPFAPEPPPSTRRARSRFPKRARFVPNISQITALVPPYTKNFPLAQSFPSTRLVAGGNPA